MSSRQLRLIALAVLIIGSVIYSIVLLDISAFIMTLLGGLLFIFLPLHNWLTARNLNGNFLKRVTAYQVVVTLGAVTIVAAKMFINAFITHGCISGMMSEMGSPSCMPVETSARTNPGFVDFGWIGTWAFWVLVASLCLTSILTLPLLVRHLVSRLSAKM